MPVPAPGVHRVSNASTWNRLAVRFSRTHSLAPPICRVPLAGRPAAPWGLIHDAEPDPPRDRCPRTHAWHRGRWISRECPPIAP